VQIRIEGSDLPGRRCGPGANGFPGYGSIHVGLQRRNRPGELLLLQPGDAPSVGWTLDCTVSGNDVKGPYVQGPPGGRFIYLSWVTMDQDENVSMFRRAKLMLDAVPEEILEAAIRSGHLMARLGLTDTHGHPLCAAVRPPLITWSPT
jgi:hypothetical protein